MSIHIEALRDIASNYGWGVCDEVADELEDNERAYALLFAENAKLHTALSDSNRKCEALKLQAECHAQEARTHRATVHEIYQLCTGSKGEPGNWNGAEPVRKLVAELAEAKARNHYLELNAYRCDAGWQEMDGKINEAFKRERIAKEALAESQRKLGVAMGALEDLRAQVVRFCETEGEWEFYTGKATQALAQLSEKEGTKMEIKLEIDTNTVAAKYDAILKAMVDRFLYWKLPADFAPDAGISFQAEYNVEYMAKQGKPPCRHEPLGTNLLNADQAMQMFKHCLPPSCFGLDDEKAEGDGGVVEGTNRTTSGAIGQP